MKKTTEKKVSTFNRKYRLLLLLSSICLLLIGQQPPTQKLYETETYKNRMMQFKQEGLSNNQIVFLGNSLTQGGKWSAWFSGQQPANRGISGDNTEGVLARLDEITYAQPAKIFLMIGINDISQNYNNDYLCKNFERIIQQIRKDSPETIVYIQSLLPVNNAFGRYKKLINKEKQIEQLNKQLKSFCKKEKIQFVNLYPLFIQKKRTLNPAYTTDGLHLNEVGYQVWASAIKDLIEK